jgi:hypothetical protein
MAIGKALSTPCVRTSSKGAAETAEVHKKRISVFKKFFIGGII